MLTNLMIMKLSVCWPCVLWAQEQVCGSSRGCGSGSLARSPSALFCTMHIRLLFPAPRPPSLFQRLPSTINCIGLKHRLFIIWFKPSVSKVLCNVLGYDSAYQNDVSFGFCRLRFCQKSNGDMSGNALFPSSFPASSFCTKTLLSQKKGSTNYIGFCTVLNDIKGYFQKVVNFL